MFFETIKRPKIGNRVQVLAGSLIGGIKETQEMLDFCGRHNITCDIEMCGAKDINVAYERAVASDVKCVMSSAVTWQWCPSFLLRVASLLFADLLCRYRFVIDAATFQETA